MTGRVQWRDEFWGIYRMNPTSGRELRDPRAMNHTADRPGSLLSAPLLLCVADPHRKVPQKVCNGSR